MKERLEGGDYRFIAICLALLAASVWYAAGNFYRAFPEASIDFRVSRGDAGQRADEAKRALLRIRRQSNDEIFVCHCRMKLDGDSVGAEEILPHLLCQTRFARSGRTLKDHKSPLAKQCIKLRVRYTPKQIFAQRCMEIVITLFEFLQDLPAPLERIEIEERLNHLGSSFYLVWHLRDAVHFALIPAKSVFESRKAIMNDFGNRYVKGRRIRLRPCLNADSPQIAPQGGDAPTVSRTR